MSRSYGWADVQPWSEAGGYIEFGESPDCLYLVRVRADVEDQVQEVVRESNNVSYALFDVTGERLEVLERAFGRSPWDTDRALAEDDLVGAR